MKLNLSHQLPFCKYTPVKSIFFSSESNAFIYFHLGEDYKKLSKSQGNVFMISEKKDHLTPKGYKGLRSVYIALEGYGNLYLNKYN